MQDLNYKKKIFFMLKISNLPGHVIPYNFISLKSNPPPPAPFDCYELSTMEQNKIVMPEASRRVTRA